MQCNSTAKRYLAVASRMTPALVNASNSLRGLIVVSLNGIDEIKKGASGMGNTYSVEASIRRI